MAGRLISDHASWAGKAKKGLVFPDGTRTKEERSAEGSGHVGTDYSDTTEAIHRDQEHGDEKIKSKKMKPGYRY